MWRESKLRKLDSICNLLRNYDVSLFICSSKNRNVRGFVDVARLAVCLGGSLWEGWLIRVGPEAAHFNIEAFDDIVGGIRFEA